MSDTTPQTYANHARFVPLYHYVLSGLLLLNLIWAGWRLFRDRSLHGVAGVLLAVALVIMFYYTRAFALAVQDRLIRLEMRLRLGGILPEDLRGRIDELTPDHLIGLRFASDAEMPDLVREVLAGKLVKRSEIKRRVRDWQPDDYRC